MKILKDDKDVKKYLPIFGTKEFLETKSKNYGWIVDKDFILPFYIDRRYIFSKLTFTTSTIYKDNNIPKNEKKFLNNAIELIKTFNVDYISQPLANAVFKEYPSNAIFIPWGSYIVDLRINEDEIWNNIHSKHKNVIRKSIKNEVSVEITNNIELIYENLKDTMTRQNRSYPSIEYLNSISKFSLFFVSKYNGKIQGCAVLPYNKKSAYYLYGGSIEKPYSGSLNYLHYKAMLHMKKIGVEQYDFMGARINVDTNSKLEGIQRFKSRFGATLLQGCTWKYIYNPFKVNLVNNIQKFRFFLKNKKYLGDAIDQELYKWQK